VKVLAFDFDGVLADTEEMIRDILHDLDIWPGKEAFLRHHDGNVWEEPQIAFDEKKVSSYISLYLKEIENCKTFFYKSDLESLATTYKLYIVSSNSEEAIGRFLKKYGLHDFFSEILGMHFHKSKVYKLGYILNKESISPGELMMLGDTLGDIKEALNANARAAFAAWGFHGKERLQKHFEKEYLEQISFFESKDEFMSSLI